MSNGPAPEPVRGPFPIVAAHGALLLALMTWLRLSKARFAGLDPSPQAWLPLMAADVGFVLLLEGVLWLASNGRGSRGWSAAVHLVHLPIYLFLAIAHQFFVNTGYRLPFDVAAYAAGRLGMLRDLLTVTGGVGALRDVAIAGGAFLLAVVAGRVWKPRPWAVSRRLVIGAALALGVALLLWAPFRDPAVRDLARNDVVAFAGSALHAAESDVDLSGFMIEPEDFYRRPEVGAGPASRPNIILLVLESTGAQAVGADFTSGPETPELAALALDSVVVEQAYGTVSHTSKALVGLLCGMLPRLELVISESLEGNLPLACLPSILRENGYRTAFLQTALGEFENRPGLVANLGFEHGAYQETLTRPPFATTGYFGLDEFAMLEPAVRLATSSGSQPFFLTLLTITPHHPYETPGVPMGDRPNEELYREALAHQDRFVGALRASLAAGGALDNTLLIVIGDHGEAHGEHGLYEHDVVPYEEVVHTPWLLHGPEALIGPPRTLDGLRSHLDLMPTLLELLDLEWSGTLPGQSVLSTPGHERVVTSCWYRSHCLGLRRDDRKVVYSFGRRPTEVYDLGVDPFEHTDLAPTLPADEVETLEAEMLAWKLSVDAFWAGHPKNEGPLYWWREASGDSSSAGSD